MKAKSEISLFWKTGIYTLLVLFTISVILPFLHIISVSLSEDSAVISGSVTVYPKGFRLSAYRLVITTPLIFRTYLNTIFVTVIGTVLTIMATMLAAYPISKKELAGRKWITFLITLTMWFSGGMIPTFLVVKTIGLYNSLFALFVPSLISAFNVIVMRNFFETIPFEMEESALIDGANDFQLLVRIYMPLSKPMLATVTLWVAVALWNDFMGPLIYLQDYNKYTLQLILRELVLRNTPLESMGGAFQDGTNQVLSDSLKYANIIFTALPILMVYPFLQKYFVTGVLIGAVKG
jgi:putative aldouronate transport system permease protein